MLRPGVHWDDIQLRCHEVLVDGFLRLGIFRNPESASGMCPKRLKYETTHVRHNIAMGGSKECDDLHRDILVSGISAAFFPHGVGHSLGMDVHDVPIASKPSKTGKYFIAGQTESTTQGGGHESFYRFLRLRLPLLAGMVVVSLFPSLLV